MHWPGEDTAQPTGVAPPPRRILDSGGEPESASMDPALAPGTTLRVIFNTVPTPGYRVQLDRPTAILVNGALELPLTVLPPEPGGMRAQILRSPCADLAVAPGAYHSITVPGLGTFNRPQ